MARLNDSLERLHMPDVNGDALIECMKELLKVNERLGCMVSGRAGGVAGVAGVGGVEGVEGVEAQDGRRARYGEI